MLAGDDFVGGGDERVRDALVEDAELAVGERGRRLDVGVGGEQLGRVAETRAAYGEVLRGEPRVLAVVEAVRDQAAPWTVMTLSNVSLPALTRFPP
jgi:hypothetical protein